MAECMDNAGAPLLCQQAMWRAHELGLTPKNLRVAKLQLRRVDARL